MKLLLSSFALLIILVAQGRAADVGPSFPILENSDFTSSMPSSCFAGDSASGKRGLTAFAYRDSSGNLVLPALDSSSRLPVSETRLDTTNTRLGDLTESAPASDTASSGLNGRLQRVAQNLTTLNATNTENGLRIGDETESAAASDTATSGINGLIKRLLQRMTTLISYYSSNFGASTGAIRTAAQLGNATGAADFNYGTVGAQTVRSAAQLGNATGAADFNYGAVGAQTLRSAAQIGNATGAASFGAGATSAQTIRTSANISDGSANALTSQSYDSQRPLHVYVMQLGASNATHTRITLTNGVSVQIAAANSARKWLIIENQSGANIFIKFGTAAVLNQALEIVNNTTYTMNATTLYTGAINAIVGSNNRTIEVIEGY